MCAAEPANSLRAKLYLHKQNFIMEFRQRNYSTYV